MMLRNRRLHLPLLSKNEDLLSFADLFFVPLPTPPPRAGSLTLLCMAMSSLPIAEHGLGATSTLGRCLASLLPV